MTGAGPVSGNPFAMSKVQTATTSRELRPTSTHRKHDHHEAIDSTGACQASLSRPLSLFSTQNRPQDDRLLLNKLTASCIALGSSTSWLPHARSNTLG
jgi:hypothetical protein